MLCYNCEKYGDFFNESWHKKEGHKNLNTNENEHIAHDDGYDSCEGNLCVSYGTLTLGVIITRLDTNNDSQPFIKANELLHD